MYQMALFKKKLFTKRYEIALFFCNFLGGTCPESPSK